MNVGSAGLLFRQVTACMYRRAAGAASEVRKILWQEPLPMRGNYLWALASKAVQPVDVR